MKNIPIFTGSTGTASLILEQIPCQRRAYVTLHSVLPGGLETLLAECRDFCVQAGAARVLVSADEPPDFLPHVHDMLELVCRKAALPPPDAPVALERVTERNGEDFLRCYNRLFSALDNAATYTRAGLTRLLKEREAYFALCGGERAGIGELGQNELRAIGVLPAFRGLGYPLALTLLHRLDGPVLTLCVSSANERALNLYDRLGFHVRRTLSRWYLLKGE